MELLADMCCKFATEYFIQNWCDFKIANPDFWLGTSFVFSKYIEMNYKLKFWPTFTEITLLLVGKIWLLINILLI